MGEEPVSTRKAYRVHLWVDVYASDEEAAQFTASIAALKMKQGGPPDEDVIRHGIPGKAYRLVRGKPRARKRPDLRLRANDSVLHLID